MSWRNLGRPFRVAWGTADTAAALKAGYEAERDRALRTRLHGLWLLRAGWRLEAVAEVVGVQYRTVQRWVAWYRAGGLETVRAHRMGGTGQASFLSPADRTRVADEVATGRFRTGAEIRDWIAGELGVTYTVAGVYSLLKRLRCAPKVPRPVHAAADPARQAAFQKGGSAERLPRPG